MLASLAFRDRCSETGCENCIVHSLFCIFIIIIIISIFFVALIKLFLSTHGFHLLSISPPHSTRGDREG